MRGRFGSARRRLLIGSHIDTVIDAGKYDGPLGVVAGILAAEHFARAGSELPFGIDVLAFGDEEGSRFPATLTSSSACAGAFESEALATADARRRDARRCAAGLRKKSERHSRAAYRPEDAAGYVEVHIEQGPVLEAKGEPLGIVTGIVGQVRLRVTVTGEAGHAGTVPMNLRHDAYAGAAEMALALETIAREHPDDGMVGTVGRIEAAPGAVNIIPGRVLFTVDLRSLTDAAAHRGHRAICGRSGAHRRRHAASPCPSSRSTRSRPRIARRRCRTRWRRASPRSAIRRSGCRPGPATTPR